MESTEFQKTLGSKKPSPLRDRLKLDSEFLKPFRNVQGYGLKGTDYAKSHSGLI